MYKKVSVAAIAGAMLLTPVPAFAFFDILLHLAAPVVVAPFAGKQRIHWCPNDVRVYKTKKPNLGYFVSISGKKQICRIK